MTDDVKVLIERVRGGVETSGWACDALDPRHVLDLLAHLDGEAARTAAAVAAAREEQREACADWLDDTVWPEAAYAVVRECRATPLTATPRADRIAELENCFAHARDIALEFDRRRLAEIGEHAETAAELLDMQTRAEKAEAERDEARKELAALKKAVTDKLHFDMKALLDGTPERQLEAERDALFVSHANLAAVLADINEAVGGAAGEEPSLVRVVRLLRAERDALRAQVEAARAVCDRFHSLGGLMWPGEVLAAMDGAKPSQG